MNIPSKWMIWGYPHFRKPPNGQNGPMNSICHAGLNCLNIAILKVLEPFFQQQPKLSVHILRGSAARRSPFPAQRSQDVLVNGEDGSPWLSVLQIDRDMDSWIKVVKCANKYKYKEIYIYIYDFDTLCGSKYSKKMKTNPLEGGIRF